MGKNTSTFPWYFKYFWICPERLPNALKWAPNYEEDNNSPWWRWLFHFTLLWITEKSHIAFYKMILSKCNDRVRFVWLIRVNSAPVLACSTQANCFSVWILMLGNNMYVTHTNSHLILEKISQVLVSQKSESMKY